MTPLLLQYGWGTRFQRSDLVRRLLPKPADRTKCPMVQHLTRNLILQYFQFSKFPSIVEAPSRQKNDQKIKPRIAPENNGAPLNACVEYLWAYFGCVVLRAPFTYNLHFKDSCYNLTVCTQNDEFLETASHYISEIWNWRTSAGSSFLNIGCRRWTCYLVSHLESSLPERRNWT